MVHTTARTKLPQARNTAPKSTEYSPIDIILNKIKEGDITDEELAYFDRDGNNTIDKTDITKILDKDSNGTLTTKELKAFSKMDTAEKRAAGYNILTDIIKATDLDPTQKQVFKDFFNIDKDEDIDILDVLSIFDTNKNGVIDGTEAKAYNALKNSGAGIAGVTIKNTLDATDLTAFNTQSAKNAKTIETALKNAGYKVASGKTIESVFGGKDNKISNDELKKIMMLGDKTGKTGKDVLDAVDFAKISKTDKTITEAEFDKTALPELPAITARSRQTNGKNMLTNVLLRRGAPAA